MILCSSAVLALTTNYGSKSGYQEGIRAPAPQAPLLPSLVLRPASSYGDSSTIPLAIQSSRTVKYIEIPAQYSAEQPLNIAVPAAIQPINILLRSQSSPLNIENIHQASRGSYKETSSEDTPDVRVHTVTRPVYQEVREVITPYRKVQQQIQPVQEVSETYVARRGGQAPAPAAPGFSATAPARVAAPVQPAYSAPAPVSVPQVKPKAPATTTSNRYAKPKSLNIQYNRKPASAPATRTAYAAPALSETY